MKARMVYDDSGLPLGETPEPPARPSLAARLCQLAEWLLEEFPPGTPPADLGEDDTPTHDQLLALAVELMREAAYSMPLVA